jgi:hypothetical protein
MSSLFPLLMRRSWVYAFVCYKSFVYVGSIVRDRVLSPMPLAYSSSTYSGEISSLPGHSSISTWCLSLLATAVTTTWTLRHATGYHPLAYPKVR